MKLKEWADKQGISYLTAWRWFKANDPRLASAYQSDSGTIIVPEDIEMMEISMGIVQTNEVMSSVLKKTVELSKNNGTIEDFAAWILSNFSLRSNAFSELPKYSRNKPKSEEVQKHFQKFIKPKGEKPKPNMFVAEAEALDDLIAKADNLTAQELVDEIHKVGIEGGVSINPIDAPEVEELMKDLSTVLNVSSSLGSSVVTYEDIAEGVVNRSVELTPQSLNYTGSSDSALGNFNVNDSVLTSDLVFNPTKKELESAKQISTIVEKPRRGRKSKNMGKK